MCSANFPRCNWKRSSPNDNEPQSDSIEPSHCDQLTSSEYDKEDVLDFRLKNVKSEPEQPVELEFDTSTANKPVGLKPPYDSNLLMFIGSSPESDAEGTTTFQPIVKKPKVEDASRPNQVVAVLVPPCQSEPTKKKENYYHYEFKFLPIHNDIHDDDAHGHI